MLLPPLLGVARTRPPYTPLGVRGLELGTEFPSAAKGKKTSNYRPGAS